MIRKTFLRILSAIVIASIWSLPPNRASAQQTTPSTSPAKTDSKATKGSAAVTIASDDSVSTADIERAAHELATAVQAAVKKATEDPAVKLAALKVATNAVNTAQLVLTQQAATLQSMLDTLSRELAVASQKQGPKQKVH